MEQTPVTAMSVKMIATITSYDEGRLCGVLDSIYFKEPFAFADVADMIEAMESTFDAVGFPDKALLPRTFGKAKERIRRQEMDIASLRESTEEMLASRRNGKLKIENGKSETGETKPLAVFEIFVNFRHNAEWQGRLRRAGGDETREFRSIVELVRLVDENLTAR